MSYKAVTPMLVSRMLLSQTVPYSVDEQLIEKNPQIVTFTLINED